MMKNIIMKMSLVMAFFALISTHSTAQLNLLCDTTGMNEITGLPCVNTIVTSVPFLRIIPDARSGAMGDVGIAISPDANAMHFNTSKLAFADQELGVSATYTPWLRALGLQDVYLAYLSGYRRIDDLQTVGLGLRYFSLGTIQFTDENGQPLGTDRPNEFELALSYSRKLSDKFAVGLAMNWVQRFHTQDPPIRILSRPILVSEEVWSMILMISIPLILLLTSIVCSYLRLREETRLAQKMPVMATLIYLIIRKNQ